ncbi:phage tail assembly chaperone [Algicola sagamiensis]|uniref:phage tail assembly chaperone n=1 Tax=Algicola sagamiensis TaxID=163869 RepID=UPI00037A2D07|nr:phage tail assembly chaperone [Algicola sagamiensis]
MIEQLTYNGRIYQNCSISYLKECGLPDTVIQQAIQAKQLREIRAKRDQLIAMTDWQLLPDSPLSEAQKSQVITYRQQLRQVPQCYQEDPEGFAWPTRVDTDPSYQ